MTKVVKTEKAPAPLAHYSQARVAGNLVFTAGQLGVAAGTRQLVSESTAEQARQALRNIAEILAAAGSTLHNVVKTNVYLTNLADTPALNALFQEFFPNDPPARTTIGVASLPLSAAVEIEAVASIE